MKTTIRNIQTKDLLLLLARINAAEFPFIDLQFNAVKRTIAVIPISREMVDERRSNNEDEGTSNIEDIINEV